MLAIQEIPGKYMGVDSDYIHQEFYAFQQSLQESVGIVS